MIEDNTSAFTSRKQVCLPSFPRPYGRQCDESPFANTRDGRSRRTAAGSTRRENRCQGGTLSARYLAAGIGDRDSYLLVIIHPDQIAQGPFQDIDIAKDQTCG